MTHILMSTKMYSKNVLTQESTPIWSWPDLKPCFRPSHFWDGHRHSHLKTAAIGRAYSVRTRRCLGCRYVPLFANLSIPFKNVLTF